MPRTRTGPDNPYDAELFALSNVAYVVWHRELGRCGHLLSLVPEEIAGRKLTVEDRPNILFAAMRHVSAKAYEKFEGEGSSKDLLAREVLAASAVIGLVYSEPKRGNPFQQAGGGRSTQRETRAEIAAKWHYSGVVKDRFIARNSNGTSYEFESLATFRAALEKTLEDTATLAQLASEVIGPIVVQKEIDEPAATPTVQTLVHRHQPDVRYIPRETLEARFNELYNCGHKLITFVGLPGMGKSWLAKHVISRSGDVRTASLRVTNGMIEVRDLQAALTLYGHSDTLSQDSHLPTFTAKLVCSANRPDIVLFDGLDSADQLRSLLPDDAQSVVVATCRAHGSAPPVPCQFIEVGKMEYAEAVAMVRQQLPELEAEDCELLATELGGYPILVRYACVLLGPKSISPQEFVRSVKLDAKALADQVTTEEGATLFVVLARLVELVRNADSLAYDHLTQVECLPRSSKLRFRLSEV